MRVDGKSTSECGAQGEQIACSFLKKNGYAILERNYRVVGGEIDIVAREGETIIFVEVKTRSSSTYGFPEESVTFTKRKRMYRAAQHYLLRFHREPLYRFDIVAIILDHHMRVASVRHIEDCPVIF